MAGALRYRFCFPPGTPLVVAANPVEALVALLAARTGLAVVASQSTDYLHEEVTEPERGTVYIGSPVGDTYADVFDVDFAREDRVLEVAFVRGDGVPALLELLSELGGSEQDPRRLTDSLLVVERWKPALANDRLRRVWRSTTGALFGLSDGRGIFRLERDEWRPVAHVPGESESYGAAGCDDDDIWVCGAEGRAFRWHRGIWTPYVGDPRSNLLALHAAPDGKVWAVGASLGGSLSASASSSAAAAWSGTAWGRVGSGGEALMAIAQSPGGELIAAGDHGTVLRMVGGRWKAVSGAPTTTLNGVAFDSSGVAWLAGDNGTVIRLRLEGGPTFLPFDWKAACAFQGDATCADFRAVVFSLGAIWLVARFIGRMSGEGGIALRIAGERCDALALPDVANFIDLLPDEAGALAIASDGTLLRVRFAS